MIHRPASANTAVVLIDAQQSFISTMPAAKGDVHGWPGVAGKLGLLLDGARALRLPIFLTTQNAGALGPIEPQLLRLAGTPAGTFDKTAFSAAAVTELREALHSRNITDLVLAGMEAHICVLQSALGFVELGYRVWVAQDAVISRAAAACTGGIHLCRELGATVAPTEAILFLLLEDASHPAFKAIAARLKQDERAP